MTSSRRNGEADIDRCVAMITARMNERVREISASIHSALEEEIPELRADVRTVELLGASVQGNVDTMLHALRHDIPVARTHLPSAATEYTRRLAQRGVPLNTLVRAYHVGQRRATELVFAELQSADVAPVDRFVVAQAIATRLFRYLDQVIQQVVAVYEGEREQWLDTRNSVRALCVRELLTGKKPVDVDSATEQIRYPLRWHHLALVVWYPGVESRGDELGELQRFVRRSADTAATSATPLFVPDDQLCGWAWLPYRSARPEAVAEVRGFAAARRDGPSVAIGTMAPGLSGFRRSHRLAQDARSVALAREDAGHRVVAADDPGLSVAALLDGSTAEVREWVVDVLGDLASDTDNDARLRDTLQVFLRTGSSYKAASAELDLHSNSVKYRVGRAVSRRGRPIGDDRLDVELALLICHWYGPAVRRPDSA
ncbi:helix-turn-helix domain-containing protein [Nocardia implantans]|uniref:Helix-turn-helix domain-containing protein n=1 Tax=Nocardia implantans TaxID=3108168 RepID=A0ABU6AYV5_9NOCA|nr:MULTISPECIES: helix-turn-helix domain-containing protein [unclassified Nocardia]MEA3529938.1 helix-turn-helix domain-containing protein [Nocardia sp. CDC192]MEB3512584.1 helix-turn-helix domain-containing protein [Nocardia sp. CDC186]